MAEIEQQRRNSKRVAFDQSVEVFCDGESLGPCRSSDLSEGGMQLKMSRIPRKSRLRLFFSVPGGGLMHLEGRVVWRKLTISGIEFVRPPADALSSLRRHVGQPT